LAKDGTVQRGNLLFARLEEKADSSGHTSPRNDTHNAFSTP
jgi:hypothetical protein